MQGESTESVGRCSSTVQGGSTESVELCSSTVTRGERRVSCALRWGSLHEHQAFTSAGVGTWSPLPWIIALPWSSLHKQLYGVSRIYVTNFLQPVSGVHWALRCDWAARMSMYFENFALQWGSPYMSVSMSPCVAMDQPVLVVVLRPCVAMYKKSVSAFIPDQARQCINAFFGPRVSTLARSGDDRIGSSNDDSSGREPHRYLFVTCYCHLNLGTLSYFTTCSTFATFSTFLAKWMSLSSFFVATRGLLLAFKGNIEILGRP